MSLPRRAVPVVAALLALVLVIAVVVILVIGDDGKPPFERGEAELSSRSAEGLLDGRTAPPAAIDRTALDDGTPVVQYRGRGSVSFGYEVVRLRKGAPAQRIRQLGSTEVLSQVKAPAVTWKGWVMAQRPRDELRGGEKPSAVYGSWRAAEGDGVLVEPGEMVRLRTRFDLSGETRNPCNEVTFEDGPTWEVREDGSDDGWRTLRYRATDPDRDVVARTGMDGHLSFRSPGDCRGKPGIDGNTVDTDGPVG